MGKIKNHAVRGVVEIVKNEYGDNAFENALESLPRDKSKLFNPVTGKPWVSFADYNDFLQAIAIECFDAEAKSLRKIGALRAEKTFKGFSRLHRLAGPKSMVRTIRYIFLLSMNIKMKVFDKPDNFASFHLFDKGDDHHFLWEEIAGTFARSIEISGGANVDVSYNFKKSERKNKLEYQITWT